MCSKFLHLYWQNLSYMCECEYTFYVLSLIFFLHCLNVNIKKWLQIESLIKFWDKKMNFCCCIIMLFASSCVSSINIFSHCVTLYNFYRYLLITGCGREKRRTFKMAVEIITRGFSVKSYCSCVSVAKAWKPKNTQTSAQGLGEIFSFLFLYNHMACSLLFLKCFTLCWRKKSHVKQRCLL